MATRTIIDGRLRWSNTRPNSHKLPAQPEVENGAVVDDRIPPNSPRSPYRAGTPYYDVVQDIEYRVVGSGILDPRQGWATAAFWVKRWKISYKQLVQLVQRGMLDAAMEQSSDVRRFRCRDERSVLQLIEAKFAKRLNK